MRIAIIGGGAAGLMAAASALEHNPTTDVLLIERNAELGKKVIISGGGRCNLTTGLTDVREVLKRYPRGGKFLTSAMHRFPPTAVRAWFEEHGVPLKVEEDLRVFPQSNDGHDIVRVFERVFAEAGDRLRVLFEHAVVRVEKTDTTFLVTFKDGSTVTADRLILTTGGQAYRQTGSTGDGYAFAESLGHTLTKLAPSLNSFVTRETWTKDVAGLSFEQVAIRADKHQWTGPFLFTHKGVSGPAIFAISALIAFESYDRAQPFPISIDLFPQETPAAFEQRLLETLRANGKKSARTVLAMFVPKSLAEVACAVNAIPDLHAADIRKTEAHMLAAWLKGIPLNIVGRTGGDEFVTAGGVSLAEVDPSTMESKKTPGLFFAGELLDIDGFTGGFNLQASWATGRAAGTSAAA